MIKAETVLLEAQNRQLETLRELKQFIVDICFDYTCKDPGCSANVGLSAIRVLCKGKQSEEEFKKVWERWRDKQAPGHDMLCSSGEGCACSDRELESD